MDISKLLTPDNPAGKPKKWTPDEDKLLIELRGKGMTWAEIAKRFSGRSPISCRLHYQNYLEKQVHWDEEQKNKLARLYTWYVHCEISTQPMTLLHTNVRTGLFCPACL